MARNEETAFVRASVRHVDTRNDTHADATDSSRRDALARTIGSRLALCNEDELRVVDVLLGRLELGRDRYGHLDLSKPRAWKVERAEELLDAHVYEACDLIAKRDEQLERLRCEVADELAAKEPVEFGLREIVANTSEEREG